jgi:hypothetical protein
VILSYFPIKILYALLFSVIRAASRAHLVPPQIVCLVTQCDRRVWYCDSIRRVSRNSEPSQSVLLPTYTKYPLYSGPHRTAEHSVRVGFATNPVASLYSLCQVWSAGQTVVTSHYTGLSLVISALNQFPAFPNTAVCLAARHCHNH